MQDLFRYASAYGSFSSIKMEFSQDIAVSFILLSHLVQQPYMLLLPYTKHSAWLCEENWDELEYDPGCKEFKIYSRKDNI